MNTADAFINFLHDTPPTVYQLPVLATVCRKKTPNSQTKSSLFWNEHFLSNGSRTRPRPYIIVPDKLYARELVGVDGLSFHLAGDTVHRWIKVLIYPQFPSDTKAPERKTNEAPNGGSTILISDMTYILEVFRRRTENIDTWRQMDETWCQFTHTVAPSLK